MSVGGVRGKPQRRRIEDPPTPGAFVNLNARVPLEVRAQARADASSLGISLAAYIELLLRRGPLDLAPDQLPLSESA